MPLIFVMLFQGKYCTNICFLSSSFIYLHIDTYIKKVSHSSINNSLLFLISKLMNVLKISLSIYIFSMNFFLAVYQNSVQLEQQPCKLINSLLLMMVMIYVGQLDDLKLQLKNKPNSTLVY